MVSTKRCTGCGKIRSDKDPLYDGHYCLCPKREIDYNKYHILDRLSSSMGIEVKDIKDGRESSRELKKQLQSIYPGLAIQLFKGKFKKRRNDHMTTEQRINKDIEDRDPRINMITSQPAFKIWKREWEDDDNEIKMDYVISLGRSTKLPKAVNFGIEEDKGVFRYALPDNFTVIQVGLKLSGSPILWEDDITILNRLDEGIKIWRISENDFFVKNLKKSETNYNVVKEKDYIVTASKMEVNEELILKS